MSTPPTSLSHPGPVLHGSFPLLWEACADDLNEHARRAVDESNVSTLRNYLLMDARIHEAGDDRDEATSEFQRLESRMNLVIDLLAQVLARDLQLPVPVNCEVSRDAVEWSGDLLPVPGARVKLSLYLNPGYPRPLVLYGDVKSLETRSGERHVRIELLELPESVSEALDRLIFRDHRRRVAQTKRRK